MNIDIESLSTTRSVLDISLTAEEVAASRKETVKDLASKVSIPGFRKGKTPLSIVEQKLGKRVEETLRDNLLRKSFQKAVDEKKDEFRVYEIVSQDEFEIAGDGTAKMKFTVDLFPKFDLPEASALKVETVKSELTDEQVEAQLKTFHNTLATFKEAEPGCIVKNEDMVLLSYAGTVDGKPLETVYEGVDSYAKSDESWCSVGYEYFMVPGLPKALVGKKEGETGTLDVEFPADFVKEALRGVKASYTYTIKKIRVHELPELTPEVLKKYDLETVDALRDRIRENMKRQMEYNDRIKNLEAVADSLCEVTTFDLPEAELDRETQKQLEHLLTYNMNKGVSKE
ncbi:MAG: trigger factor, partial [Kiritimatiellia bacterium]